MNTKALKEALQKRFENRFSLTEYMKLLASLGITEYHVDLSESAVKYTDSEGMIHNVAFPKDYSYDINSTYDPIKLQKANEAMMQHGISFTGFLQALAEAGVAGYLVDLNSKYVTYFGIDDNRHMEPII